MAMAYLLIDQSSSFSKDIVLRGKAGSAYADIALTVVVCGDETIDLIDANTPVIVNELLTSGGNKYLLDYSKISGYFNVDRTTTDSSPFCGDLSFALFSDVSGTAVLSGTDVTLDGGVGA